MTNSDHRAAPIITGAMIARGQAKARQERAKAFAGLCRAAVTALRRAASAFRKFDLIGRLRRA